MKEFVFFDTGFWIALMDKNDQRYEIVQTTFSELSQYQWHVSDFVIFETLTYLNCSIKRHDLAIQFLGLVEESGIFILTVGESEKKMVLNLFQTYHDKDLSMTDCSSFVLMKNKGIARYAGFDNHFAQLGFLPVLKQHHPG